MSIHDPRIEAIREKYIAMEERQRKAGNSRISFRFVLFIQHIERCERFRVRFAAHVDRVADSSFYTYQEAA